MPSWPQQTPTPVCPPKDHADPNPKFPSTATLTMCTPLQVIQPCPDTVLVTVSIPAETIFTLPTDALEIKKIKKNLKITQCRFFNSPPSVFGIPQDTPKLFLGGFVRKDIQYSEPIRHTKHTVEGKIRDFVIDVPWSCVVDLGSTIVIPPTLFNQQQEYEFFRAQKLPRGFAEKDELLSSDLSEFNEVSNEFFNRLPKCTLVFSQINEMDEALDREPLKCGPFEEGLFRKVQEKMIIVLQLRLTFEIDCVIPTKCDC
jgi:hypothetical protein